MIVVGMTNGRWRDNAPVSSHGACREELLHCYRTTQTLVDSDIGHAEGATTQKLLDPVSTAPKFRT
jgi:hypothetical protein